MENERGFSLVESLLVIALIGSIAGLLANLPNAISLVNKSKHTSLAKEIAVKQIEDKRMVKYDNLVNGETPAYDSRLSLLPQGAGFTLVEDCEQQICASGELIKQITATITWKDNNKTQTVFLKTMVGEGGLK